MYPRHLALIDNDADHAQNVARQLKAEGVGVSVFGNGKSVLDDLAPGRFDFFMVDMSLPDICGIELISTLRRHSDAGLLAVSGERGPEPFADAMSAGADMFLSKPVPFEQVDLAIRAVHRRAARTVAAMPSWQLDRRGRALVAPDGARVALSDADLTVLECFVEAAGETVTRERLSQRLGRARDDDGDDGLNAIIYRLRRRIERATPMLVPLQSRSRVGYTFRATLSVADH